MVPWVCKLIDLPPSHGSGREGRVKEDLEEGRREIHNER